MFAERNPSPMPRVPHFVRENPDGEVAVYVLGTPRPRISIGRGHAMDIVMDGDASISKLHALLETVSGEWLMIDAGLSRNGTFVNGERMIGQRRLRDGDRVRIGRTELTFRLPSRPVSPRVEVFIPLPRSHRRVLAELARPLRRDGTGIPATDTDIALRLAVKITDVRHALAEICVLYGISDSAAWRRRARLAELALAILADTEEIG